MSALVGALRVTLGLNSANYEAGMRRAGRTARTTGRDINSALASAQRTAINAFRGIAAAAAGAGLGAAAYTFARYVDAAKLLEAQLRLATRESGNFAQAQEDVRRIAQSSRAGIEEVANLYATFQRNARELGISQAEAARMTETITKAFQISGATAAEAAGGLRQFLQGIQSGTLRGEELNSVLENAPRLARALADGLGVSIGELRRMGQEGELTGQKVTRALLGASDAIDSEFRALPTTFDQAMTQVRNAAIVAFGAFDRGGGFSDALISFAGTGEMSFDRIEQAAFDTGREIRAIIAGLGNVFDPMAEGASNVFDFILSEARGLRNAIADVLSGLGSLWDSAAAAAALAGGQASEASRILIERPASQLGNRFLSGSGNPIIGAVLDATRQAGGRARDMIPAAPVLRPIGGGTGSGSRGSGRGRGRRSGQDSAQRLADEAARRRHDVESELNRATIDELRAQHDLARSTEQRALLSDQISFLEQQQAEAERRLSVLLRDRTQAEADAVADIETRRFRLEREAIAEEQRRELFEQRLDLEEQQFEFEADALRHQADLADTAAERRRIELELLDLAYRHQRAKLDAILAEETAGSHAWNRARAERDALQGRYDRDRSGVMRGTMGPLEQFGASLPSTAARMTEALESVKVRGLESLTDGLADVITGTRSLADAFSDMARSIISDLVRIAIQQAIIAPLVEALSGGGGGGGFFAFLSSSGSGSAAMKLPGFATGGTIRVGGHTGIDRNILSLNSTPIARVSRGEDIGISNGGPKGIVEVRLRDEMLDARIVQGSGVVLAQAYPAMRADTARHIQDNGRRR